MPESELLLSAMATIASVTDLLVQQDFEPEPVADAATANIEWVLRLSYPTPASEDTLVIVGPRGRPFLIAQCAVAISAEQREIIAALAPDKIRDFRFELLRDLLVFGQVQYGLEEEEEGLIVRGVRLTRRVWDGSLTVERLERALHAIYDAAMIVRIHVQRVTRA